MKYAHLSLLSDPTHVNVNDPVFWVTREFIYVVPIEVNIYTLGT